MIDIDCCPVCKESQTEPQSFELNATVVHLIRYCKQCDQMYEIEYGDPTKRVVEE